MTLAPGVAPPDPELARAFYTTSSCGLCGKASIDAVETVSAYDVADDPATVDAATLTGFPDALRAQQAVFDKTGGLHAAALFDAATGELLVLREDVGRHNAVDKVVGWAVLNDRLPLRGVVLQVSGRASFELVQKAVMAGIPILAAVSAPSSLAVELAASAGLTLVGFLRGQSMNIYTRDDRIVVEQTAAVHARSEAVGAPRIRLAHRIRPFRSGDEAAVADVCLRDSGCRQPTPPAVRRRCDLGRDLRAARMSHRHPDLAFVVEADDGRVAGYIVCAPDTAEFEDWFADRVVARARRPLADDPKPSAPGRTAH